MTFTLLIYSLDNIFGDALTLLSTEPLMPMEAFALAYASIFARRLGEQLMVFAEEPSISSQSQMLFPA